MSSTQVSLPKSTSKWLDDKLTPAKDLVRRQAKPAAQPSSPVGWIVLGIVLALIAGAFLMNLPDMRRYARISRM